MCLYQEGVLITGDSGIGKSELALALIQAGHQLIADDVTEFVENDKQELIGQCPPLLKNFLAIKDLGILNIPLLFGQQAVIKQQPLKLVVHLSMQSYNCVNLFDDDDTQIILNKRVAKITLSVLPHRYRNLSLLVQTAVQNFKLKQQGYDASADFVEHHQLQLRNC